MAGNIGELPEGGEVGWVWPDPELWSLDGVRLSTLLLGEGTTTCGEGCVTGFGAGAGGVLGAGFGAGAGVVVGVGAVVEEPEVGFVLFEVSGW